MTNQDPCKVRIRDGRLLSYAEYGDTAGRPVLYFHGFPGSRIEARLMDGVAARHRIRLVAIDRPGYGYSDPSPDRTILDWPDDVAQLADRLGMDRFVVIGVSGGGPYCVACALRLGSRLDGAAILCGLGPVDDPAVLDGMMAQNRVGLLAARRAPWLSIPVFSALAPMFRTRPQLLVSRLASHTAAPDREVLARSEVHDAFADTFREAFRQGPRGPARDGRLYAQPWGFRLEDVETTVHLWHGEQDVVVPVAMGHDMAKRLPDCRATFYPDDGHFSLPLDRAEEIFKTMLDATAPAP